MIGVKFSHHTMVNPLLEPPSESMTILEMSAYQPTYGGRRVPGPLRGPGIAAVEKDGSGDQAVAPTAAR